MNQDFRVSTHFFDHPKTLRLLRIEGPVGVACLMKLWAWAAIHAPDGDLSELEAHEIKFISGIHDWQEAGSDILQTWVDCGFLTVDNDGRHSLKNWASRQPWVADFPRRSKAARLGGLARSRLAKRDEKGRLLPAKPAASQPPAQSLEPAPSPSPSPSPQSKDKRHAANRNGSQPGFDLFWEQLRPWFKLANRRLAYKAEAAKVWRSMKCEPHADKIAARVKKQRQHFEDAQRSGQRPPPPQDPHRYLKNRRFNDEIL